jgi:hypothetical protein
MHKLYLALLFFFILVTSIIVGQNAGAASSDIMIYQVQAGGESNTITNGFVTVPATREFISIYNNTDQEVDITDWCLLNKSDKPIVCFNPPALNIFFHMPSYSYVTISSDNFASDHKYESDFIYTTINTSSGSIVAGSDAIKLVDANGALIDDLSWLSNLPGSYLYQRNKEPLPSQKLIDTGSLNDFTKISSLVVPVNKTLEEFEVFDACRNIVGIQEMVPTGDEVDVDGNCAPPPVSVCPNLDVLYTVLPVGYLLDENGNCQPDLCLNIVGLQMAIPDGMAGDDDGKCLMRPLPLQITELFPNPLGNDTGNEFIEIYNPNTVDIDLSGYGFYIDSDYIHKYDFPTSAHIGPDQYLAFYNDDIRFTLTNTNGLVRLVALNDLLIDETSTYKNASDNMAWDLINKTWQWTNQPTPNKINLPSLVEAEPEVVIPVSTLVPCKDGQYRSEETHRCRNIIRDVADLMPCAEGQERNPATNRCRSIATAVLGDSTLKPCDPGQERNPDTNRCRNVVATIPTADYAPEQVNVKNEDYTSWYIMGGLGLIAIGYGVWEWRIELGWVFRKLFKIK